MKKKNIYKIGILGVFFMSLLACKDSFFDSAPSDKANTATFYSDEASFILGINGVYNALAESRKNQDFFPMLEIATPCATMGNYTNSRFVDYGWGKNGYTPTSTGLLAGGNGWWRLWWRGVRRACDIINQLETHGDVIKTEGLKDRIEGEARFLRAYNYFYLTYLFGDVPYIVSATDTVYPYRAPHSKIVDYMIDDLKKAETLLPSATTYRGTDDIGRASQGSAMTLLGKIYCYEKRWAEAETQLKKVEASDDYKLNDSFVDQFVTQAGENSDESIFEIQYIADHGIDRASSYATFCGIQEENLDGKGAAGFNYNEPTEYLTDMYETKNGYEVKSTWVGSDNIHHHIYTFTSDDPAFDPENSFANRDPRLMYTVKYEGSPYMAQYFPLSNFTAMAPPVQNYGTVKYVVIQNYSENSGQNEIVMRYADVLLLIAEALMEQNKGAEAATYVNQVRDRASVAMPHVPQSVYEDQSKLREYIHKERIRELAMEYGHVFMDLHRWGIYASEMNKFWTAGKHGNANATQANFTSTQDLWPIPQSELDLNPNLTQNPGY